MYPDEKTWTVHIFAEKAGVSTRTIRYYDQTGLLRPSKRTEAGYRLYSERDFARLQQILTLKFIGLSLGQIKRLLTDDPVEIQKLLTRQIDVLDEKVRHFGTVIRALKKSQDALEKTHELDWNKFIEIIRAVTMENQFSWFNQFYTDDQKKKLAERAKNWTEEDQKKITEEWNALFDDIRNNISKPPESPEAQALADRWLELIGQFTQGDPALQSSLNNAYANIDKAPESVQQWAAAMREPQEFVMKALEARKKK